MEGVQGVPGPAQPLAGKGGASWGGGPTLCQQPPGTQSALLHVQPLSALRPAYVSCPGEFS